MPEAQENRNDYEGDIPVGEGKNLTVINAIREYKNEAWTAKRTRMNRNRVNKAAYLGIQNWEHKTKGQSSEFLPKTAVAVEQFVGFAKRALTQFGDWFQVELGRDSRSPLSEDQIRNLMTCHLDNCLTNDNIMSNFATVLADALKVGALESLVVIKVHGHTVLERSFDRDQGPADFTRTPREPSTRDTRPWRLRLDVVRLEDYYPDPTGRGLYEIHEVESDLFTLQQRAKEGIYDQAVVDEITSDFQTKEREHARNVSVNQDQPGSPSFRHRVVLTEFWGTILDEDGAVAHENCLCTIANERFLVRKPIPNPFWHGESPFVAVPLIRVPFSTWHKALMDHAVQLNLAQNELFNLILDGGLASVHGIKQLRSDDLEDPSQAQDGIPQGETLIVKNTLPHGAKVLEQVTEGQVPPDAQATFELLNREFTMSALSNELKLGNLPAKQVKATEIQELSQSQAITLDSITSDIERSLIQKVLRKSWLTILQNINDTTSEETIDSVGMRGAFVLSQMTPAQRFATFASFCRFRVHGLSQTLAKVRDFQKTMSLLQVVVQNPLMLQAFFQEYSPTKLLASMMKMLNINPTALRRNEEELARVHNDLANLPTFQMLTGQNPGAAGQQGSGVGRGQGVGGEGSEPAAANATANQSASLAGIGGS